MLQGVRSSHIEFGHIDGAPGTRADEVYTTQDPALAGQC